MSVPTAIIDCALRNGHLRFPKIGRNMTFDDVRAMALPWPFVEDSTSYRTLSLKVKGKLYY